jgi:Spy/CpxP family protein refolding chaperone
MKSPLGILLAMILLTVVGAGFGGWFGVQYGLSHASHRTNLDQLLHSRLDLTDAQNRHIAALETKFAKRREDLEAQMRSADRDLAAIITTQHVYNDEARHATDRFHRAMRALQDATILHVLAMRAVLTPQQAKAFDATVRQSLDSNPS